MYAAHGCYLPIIMLPELCSLNVLNIFFIATLCRTLTSLSGTLRADFMHFTMGIYIVSAQSNTTPTLPWAAT